MRISTRSYARHIQKSISRAQQELRRLSEQLTSGKRLTCPSDDPVAIGDIINARSDLATVLNRQKVLQKAERLTGPADTALDNISSALRDVKDLVLGATQPGLTDTARLSQAEIIRGYRERIFDEANISVQGDYLFAGKLSNTQPFEETAGVITYTGDSEGLELWVAPERPMEVTLPGDGLFNFEDAGGDRAVSEVDTDLFTLLDDIADAIEAGDDNALPDMAEDLDALYQHVVGQRGVLGARVQRIEDAQHSAGDMEVAAREILSDIEDVDIASALVDLQHQQVCYQAALSATAKLAQLPTLFEMSW